MSIKRFIKQFLLILLIIALFALGYIFIVKKPSNDRNWEYGMDVLPTFAVNENIVDVKNIRDQVYVGEDKFKQNYFDRTYDTNNITKVWFVVSKFSGFGGVAHTYFVFDMANSDPVTVSVEARREKGEKYSLTGGFFNNFELMYVWATERDSIVRRSIISKDDVYMYELTLPVGAAKKLFLELAKRSEELNSSPRFYNTLLSNCTNELAKTANEIRDDAIPWNVSLYLPGYSAEELYKLKYIKSADSFKELERRAYITTFVRENYDNPLLTPMIRDYLIK